MIKVNQIPPHIAHAYDPEGNLLGIVNEYEFNDLRIQIKQAKATGYYIETEGKKFHIQSCGRMVEWPEHTFHLWDKQLDELLWDN